MKAERLVWQDSTCFTLNSQCWNNDGISQGNTRGSKGFLWLWKRMAAQGAVTGFLFRDGLPCLLFICGRFFMGFMILLPLMAPSSGQCRCARADGSGVNRSCSLLNLSSSGSYHQPRESCCVWWHRDCAVGHGFLVSACPPGVPQSLPALCATLNADFSPAGFAACARGQSTISRNEEMQGSIPQYKNGTRAEGTEMIQKTEIWRRRRKRESNVRQKRSGNYRSNSVGKQNM